MIRVTLAAVAAFLVGAGIAVALTSDTNESLWGTLEASSMYKTYQKQNPNEAARVKTYWLNGGAKPTVATKFGVFLVEVNEDRAPAPPPPPPTDTTPTNPPPPPTDTTPTTPPPTGCASSTPNVPDGPDGNGGCFPGTANTGPNAPASAMATYTGSCTINTPNVTIDSKVVNCRVLNIGSGGGGFTLKNSYLNGGITQSGSPQFSVVDSLVDSGVQYPAASSGAPAGKYACGDPNNATTDCGITGTNFTILRTEIINSNRAAYCEAPGPCLIQDSYFHGTNLWPDKTNLAHASSVREEQNATIRHNSLWCSYTGPFVNGEIGCSADLTGYPDFIAIKNNTVDRNLFVASIGSGFCAYGGATGGKPHSGDSDNATNQKFTNNVFQRGSNGKCAAYGPVTDFNTSRSGNVWSGNVWDNGGTVAPG